MILYKYTFYTADFELECQPVDGFEEKPHSFVNPGITRVSKKDILKPKGDQNCLCYTLWLPEKDDKRAAETFVGYFQELVEYETKEFIKRKEKIRKMIKELDDTYSLVSNK